MSRKRNQGNSHTYSGDQRYGRYDGHKLSRDESWLRRKAYGEKWPRFSSEVPPELCEELDALIGTFNGPADRAVMVRAGLRLYLEAVKPEDKSEIIDSTAQEVGPEPPQISP